LTFFNLNSNYLFPAFKTNATKAFRLIANVIHTSLNYRGGAEALAMTTIEALADLGFDIELAVVEKPQREKLRTSSRRYPRYIGEENSC
jgi:hypothetical protein